MRRPGGDLRGEARALVYAARERGQDPVRVLGTWAAAALLGADTAPLLRSLVGVSPATAKRLRAALVAAGGGSYLSQGESPGGSNLSHKGLKSEPPHLIVS